MALLGVYVGNSRNNLNAFENWMGRDADLVHIYVGRDSWSDFQDSAEWLVNNAWQSEAGNLLWSVPLTLQNGSLSAAADGNYDGQYSQLARTIAEGTPGNDAIYIRPGWELNGNWFPWSAINNPGDYIAAWRNLVDEFREVSGRFRFEWNVNESWGPFDPARAYPGDSYVDIIGMDMYWVPQWKGNDPVAAWNTFKSGQTYDLDWLADFASDHGKRIAISEWGVMTSNGAPFIERMADWLEGNNVLYHVYWDSDAGEYATRLSDGGMGGSGTTYRNEFDGESSGGTDEGSGGGTGGGTDSGGGTGGGGSVGGGGTSTGEQRSYRDNPFWVGENPVEIAAYQFDTGGQGVSYRDTTSGDLGGSAGRNAPVDIKGNNEAIAWIDRGEWVEYTINVEEAGRHRIDFETSSPNGGGSVIASFAQRGAFYEEAAEVWARDTNSWDTFRYTSSTTVDLREGQQVLRLWFGGNGDLDVATIRLDRLGDGFDL